MNREFCGGCPILPFAPARNKLAEKLCRMQLLIRDCRLSEAREVAREIYERNRRLILVATKNELDKLGYRKEFIRILRDAIEEEGFKGVAVVFGGTLEVGAGWWSIKEAGDYEQEYLVVAKLPWIITDVAIVGYADIDFRADRFPMMLVGVYGDMMYPVIYPECWRSSGCIINKHEADMTITLHHYEEIMTMHYLSIF